MIKGGFHADLYERSALLRETFGEFDQNAAIGWITDLPERNHEPQSFDHVQVDLVIAKQLQQLVAGVIGIIDVHRERSGRQ
jgi:hypothetical protein